MATPAIVTDGVTEFDAASMNKFIAGNGTKVQIKVVYATIVYSGGDLVVSTDYDSCGLTSGDISYNTGNDTCEITLSGFVNRPQAQVSRLDDVDNLFPSISCSSNTLAVVSFYDFSASPIVQSTPGSPAAEMQFNVFFIGY